MNKTTSIVVMLAMVAAILAITIIAATYILLDGVESNDSQVATIVTVGGGFSVAVFGFLPTLMSLHEEVVKQREEVAQNRQELAEYHKEVNGHMAELMAVNKIVNTAAGNAAGRVEQLAEQAAVVQADKSKEVSE